jgi:hypothetical protein
MPIRRRRNITSPAVASPATALRYIKISLFIVLSSLFFLAGCASLEGAGKVAGAPVEDELLRYGMDVGEAANPYIGGNITNHASIPFDSLGQEFPFYRTSFWDGFKPRDFEILDTDDEKPNCLGGLQLNYYKWVYHLSDEFGYANPMEMLYYGKVFTAVKREDVVMKRAGSLNAAMKQTLKRDFYSFFDYMSLNYAEFSWIAFERMYEKRWVVAMKYDEESGLDGFNYWLENKDELPIRIRLPMIESFGYIPREGDIVVGLYNQTNYPRHYISHILFCVQGGDDPLFAEQFERHGYFKPFSLLMDEEFDYGFEAVLRPFYPVDPEKFDEFAATDLSAYNEPIPDGSIFLAPKKLVQSYLLDVMKKTDVYEAGE